MRPRNEIPELFTFQNLIGRAIATMLANAKLSGIKDLQMYQGVLCCAK